MCVQQDPGTTVMGMAVTGREAGAGAGAAPGTAHMPGRVMAAVAGAVVAAAAGMVETQGVAVVMALGVEHPRDWI